MEEQRREGNDDGNLEALGKTSFVEDIAEVWDWKKDESSCCHLLSCS